MPAWVFPSLEGTALEERNVRHVFRRLLEKAELRHMRIHDLRHTYALLLQAGAPITYVSQQLGHRDASITLRVYAHWLPDASRREADRLDTLQPSATPAQPEVVSDDQVIRAKSFGRMVSRIFASWNRIGQWLRHVDGLRTVCRCSRLRRRLMLRRLARVNAC
jgi:Phage integrase family